eukprot:TRINITY_DN47017_c0_g1_i1.p1 TRINITY_DN47017_c0_g1~~TRINITY_DN47017_c0_g1_i1.p1  ORF type:complete len:510 (+),score=-70.55 TRINITY_DN47017_c0_g1_i1:67-1596(+)
MKKILLLSSFIIVLAFTSKAQNTFPTSGNVGIGTTTPNYPLDLNGNLNISGSYKIGGKTVFSYPGSNNSFLGENAGLFNTTGTNNIFIGFMSGMYTSGSKNVFVGNHAGEGNGSPTLSNTGSANTFMGWNSGFKNTTGYSNTFIGHESGAANTTGFNNTFFGSNTGAKNNGGTHNAFFGVDAGNKNISGSYNLAIGTNAGKQNTNGHNNTYIGVYAGQASVGSNNTFIGYNSGNNNTGSDNLFIGKNSGSTYDNTVSSKLDIGGTLFGDLTNGNIGIGTTNPNHKLDVNGTVRAASFVLNDGSTISSFPWQKNNEVVSNTGHRVVIGGDTFTGTYNPSASVLQLKSTAESYLSLQGDGTNLTFGSSQFGNNFYSLGSTPLKFLTNSKERLVVNGAGNVFIGTTTDASNLYVHGNIESKLLEVKATIPVPDYVFAEDYELPTLKETEDYIKENHHLPEIPSAKEIEKDGIDVGKMNLLLLKKIEELTLHMIELKKQNSDLVNRVSELEKQ